MGRIMDMGLVPIGRKFRWRATPVNAGEEYTAIETPPDRADDETWARCAHGREDKFNSYATVELVD